MLLEIRNFFETYKHLQNKKVKVLSIKGAKAAHKCIEKGIKLYTQKFQGK